MTEQLLAMIATELKEANRLKRIELVMRADQMSYIDLEGNHFGPDWHALTLDVIRGD